MNLEKTIFKQVKAARAAALKLAIVSTSEKNAAIARMARALETKRAVILKANARDIAAGKKAGLSNALIDRLTLNDARVKAMADGLVQIARLPDPAGRVLDRKKRPNGLIIEKISTPIGVVGIIYESRPNVTSDCAGLCLKSGNSVVLKGGKEAIHSNTAIYNVLKAALQGTKVPPEAFQLITSTDRAAVGLLLRMDAWVDLIVPRGGEGLIRFVAEHSRIPVVKHYKGVCHTYVSDKADLRMAGDICFNAKVQRPGVCNAMETMLVHAKVAKRFLPVMLARFAEAGVEIRGDAATRAIVPGVRKAAEADWPAEYLDLILAVKVVKSTDEAVEHINTYGSRHSDAIVTRDRQDAAKFLNSVDSSSVYVNASTRFTDGYEFGLGAEVGISTDKLHVRGPMGLEGLTSYKYVVRGTGQVRK